jgi:hypothetical protein
MKKFATIAAAVIIMLVQFPAQAQNTFPASGNVGLGTTSPTEQLELTGNILLPSAGNGGGSMFFGSNNSIRGLGINFDPLTTSNFTHSNLDFPITGFKFQAEGTSGISTMHFMNTGLGINTPYPKEALDVNGNIFLPYPTIGHNGNGNLVFGGNPIFNQPGMVINYNGIVRHSGNIYGQEFGFYLENVSPLKLTKSSVEVGVTGPTALNVNGTTKTTGFQLTTGAAAGKILVSDASGIASWSSASSAFSSGWTSTGNNLFNTNTGGAIGINCTAIPAGYMLSVNGHVRARKIRVDSETWCDYVFAEGYNLTPIKELEKFISTYKHLPEIPSAMEVKEQGIDLADMDARLLKKVEEMTLYIIQLEKRIESLEKK